LKYTDSFLIMKNLLGAIVFLFICSNLFSQAPDIEWQKCYGGIGYERSYSIDTTFDGGYILGAFADFNNGDVSGVHVGADCWIVKTDSISNLEWGKCLGGTEMDGYYFVDVHQTTDSGFIVATQTSSNNGDVSGNHGSYDFWVVKLNSSGEIQWQKCLGGSGFDIAFERGDYRKANTLLSALSKGNSYGYLFRRSKYQHYDGSLDTAIACMKRAAEKTNNNNYLKQAALSNAADLCLHKGLLEEAADLYLQSLSVDAADFHSMSGLGWIALVHDKNHSLAATIFRFVQQHQHSPDALLNLEQVAEAGSDSLLQKKYAAEFARQAGDSIYGRMYNKYLIDLYTSVLHQPAKAVALAKEETLSRPTPQVFAWYAWSLFCNNEQDKAYSIFKGWVSGRPLEGLELYYMGKMMQGLNKGYNAQEFFKAAYKNRYDLSPAKQKELDKI